MRIQFITNISIVFAMLFMLSSCQHDTDILLINPGQPNGPDTNWVTGLTAQSPASQLREDIRKALRKDSFLLSNIGTIAVNLSSGIQLRIPATSIQNLNGIPYEGMVKTESILLRNNGDLIRMGISSRFNEQLLINEGTIFLNLMNERNEVLNIDPEKPIQISYDPFSQNYQGIKLFLGTSTLQDPGFNWIPINDSTNFFVGGPDNKIITNQLGWISCSKIGIVPSSQRTRLEIKLPSNYTNANSLVFVSLNRYRLMIRLNANSATRSFQSGNLPVQDPLTVVVLSKQGNAYFMQKQTLYLDYPNQNETFVKMNMEPVITSLSTIQQLLDQL
jgi:hypothetical protein